MIDHMGIAATFGMAILLSLTGCGDSSAAIRRRIADELSDMSVATESDVRMAAEHCRGGACLMQSLDGQARQMALDMCSGKLRQARFDESSYGNRLASLDRYVSLVGDICTLLEASGEDRDGLWRFKLDAFQRINDELKKCEAEPKGGPYVSIPPEGGFMTQRNYLERLRRRRFDLVQSEFETGPFTLHYKGLPLTARSNWLARIEHAAGRQVVVFDPARPFEQLPRYIPKDEREWLPSSDPSKPREYIEHLGGGKTIRMRETR